MNRGNERWKRGKRMLYFVALFTLLHVRRLELNCRAKSTKVSEFVPDGTLAAAGNDNTNIWE